MTETLQTKTVLFGAISAATMALVFLVIAITI